MSKRTLGLIVVLIILTGILFYFALSQPAPQVPPVPSAVSTPTPTVSPAHTTLMLSAAAPGQVNVNIDTHGDKVTAVQLDLSYDPTIMQNVKVTKATFFDQSVELFNQVNTKDGKISYAIGITPTAQPKSGQGVVATITYDRVPGATQAAWIKFMDKTKVTAFGISSSVLKSTTGLAPTVTQ